MRYTEFRVSKLNIWFLIHICLNIFAVIIIILAFIIILAEHDWKWVTVESGMKIFYLYIRNK
jgi:hypothetical protein